MYGQGGLKLEINIPPQQIFCKMEGGVISSGYGISWANPTSISFSKTIAQKCFANPGNSFEMFILKASEHLRVCEACVVTDLNWKTFIYTQSI